MDEEEFNGVMNLSSMIIGAMVYHFIGLLASIIIILVLLLTEYLITRKTDIETIATLSVYGLVYPLASVITSEKIAVFIVMSSIIFTFMDE